ncbi:MAG TPA: NAD-dependent epimerase/dehydratase family protein [Isosphaeraceae bacterium]|nr:NAD-dependent epimerase/dehydratase family protein [Isosphaeraceae bacterium]
MLLTGATGFVGSHLLRRLLADGTHDVAVLMRGTSVPWRVRDVLDRAGTIRGELDDLEPAAAAVADFAPDTVVHLAWDGVGNQARNSPAQVGNIPQTVDLVRLAGRVGAKHWIGLGSQAEYGPCEGPISEDNPNRPTTLYGIAKLSVGLLAERFCAELGLRFAWLRLFSCYGPMDDPAWMIPYLILKLLRGERPSLTGGAQLWDYIYVADVAEAIRQTALNPSASGVFNLGSGRVETIRNIVEKVRDFVDPGLPLGFGEIPYRPDQVMHLQADIGRLQSATGWSPGVGLDDGLRRTVKWFRENSSRYES